MVEKERKVKDVEAGRGEKISIFSISIGKWGKMGRKVYLKLHLQYEYMFSYVHLIV